MKSTTKILGLFLFVTLFTLTSCHKKSDDDTQDDSTGNKITLKIDNEPEITFSNVTGSALSGQLVMGGSNSNGDIQIIVNADISEGTYTSANQVLMSHGVNSQAVFTTATNVTSISFVVTTHNIAGKHIKGTFSLEYNDNQNVNVTHTATGTFDVKYR